MLSAKELSNFIDKIKVNPDAGCWEWNGSLINSGYGSVKLRKHSQSGALLAHRVAYCHFNSVSVSDIDGLMICHKCDNPSCVNPKHLFIGTQSDNMQDMMSKGRKKRPYHVGSKNPRSKIKEGDVIKIASLLGTMNNKEIAEQFGVSHSTISLIRCGKRWAHVTGVNARVKYESIRKVNHQGDGPTC